MAWSTPKTWAVDEIVTAASMNQEIRDNVGYLGGLLLRGQALSAYGVAAEISGPRDSYLADEATDYTTTSTSFVDVDATDFSMTITTTGGDVQVGFTGSVFHSVANAYIHLDIDVDGSPFADDGGAVLIRHTTGSVTQNASFVVLITGLSAASHTFKLQWKTSVATASMWAGQAAPPFDVHPQFWVREV